MKKLLLILCLLIAGNTFAQTYDATTGIQCTAYVYREGTFVNAPYVTEPVELTWRWLYCGPWSGNNSGHIYVSIYLNDGWNPLFDVTDSGNGCSWVIDYYNIPAAIWNEAVDANGGSVLVRAYANDSCPGGVGCSFYSDPCFEGIVNFDYVPIEEPVAEINIEQSVSCTGQSILIQDLSTGEGISYTWDFGDGAIPADGTTAGDQTVSYSTPGTKTVSLTVSNIAGDSTTSFDIEVNPSPELTTTPDFDACANTFPQTIEAFGTGEFYWPQSDESTSAISISPLESESYLVELTNEFNCTSTASINVTVFVAPLLDAGEDATICAGESVDLSGSGDEAAYWEMYPEDGQSISVSPSETTSYIFYALNEFGCEEQDVATVFVNPLPEANAGEDLTICNGDEIVLLATGGDAYLWDNELGPGAQQNVSPSENTTYTVTVSSTEGCTATDEVEVMVDPVPEPIISEDASICPGASTIIAVFGGVEYNWDQGLGSGAEHEVSPSETTTYTAEVSNEEGCSASASVTITVFPVVELSISGLNDSPYCHLDLNAYNLLGSPAGGVFSGLGVTGNQFIPSNAGIGMLEVFYTYEDENGCEWEESVLVEVEICGNVSEQELSFEIYPNPVREEILVTWNSAAVRAERVEILSLQGELVLSESLSSQDDNFKLSVQNLASGVYLMRVSNGNGSFSKRFVKQ